MTVLWIALFLIIIGISFVLAFQSMKDYSEAPEQSREEYGLFLVRQIENFDAGVLDSIRKLIFEQGLIISIERLFKGSKAALTIFGPKQVMGELSSTLNLLELEDYILGFDSKDITIWEVGMRHTRNLNLEDIGSILEAFPKLNDEDQFFWQVIVGVRGNDDLPFHTQIRAAVYCQDPLRRKVLVPLFQNLKLGKLIKIPKPYRAEQMLMFYRQRVLSKDSKGPILDSTGLIRLVKFKV